MIYPAQPILDSDVLFPFVQDHKAPIWWRMVMCVSFPKYAPPAFFDVWAVGCDQPLWPALFSLHWEGG